MLNKLIAFAAVGIIELADPPLYHTEADLLFREKPLRWKSGRGCGKIGGGGRLGVCRR